MGVLEEPSKLQAAASPGIYLMVTAFALTIQGQHVCCPIPNAMLFIPNRNEPR